MRGVVLEKDRNSLVINKVSFVHVEPAEVLGAKGYKFSVYGICDVKEEELNCWLDVDYDDINKIMFCLTDTNK